MKFTVKNYGNISNIAVCIGEYIVYEYNINLINRLNQIDEYEYIHDTDIYDELFEDIGNVSLQTGII